MTDNEILEESEKILKRRQVQETLDEFDRQAVISIVSEHNAPGWRMEIKRRWVRVPASAVRDVVRKHILGYE